MASNQNDDTAPATKADIKTLLNRFDQMDGKFEKIDDRFENINERFEKIDERFEKIDERFEKIDDRFENINERFERIDERFEKIDKKFKEIDINFERVLATIMDLERKFNEKLEELKAEVHAAIFDNTTEENRDRNTLKKTLINHERRIESLEKGKLVGVAA